MAPITRSAASAFPTQPANFLDVPSARETSWGFTGDAPESDGARDESVEPGSASYDGEELLYEEDESPFEQNAGADDILHPLREAANRVGNEVELFARTLDEYNTFKAGDLAGRLEMAYDLVESFQGVAIQTRDMLREQHAAELRREDGTVWRRKMKGFKINKDPEFMDLDDEEEDLEELDSGQPTTLDDLQRWEEELQTWRLMERVIRLEYDSPKSANETDETIAIHRYSSEKQLWNNFLESDHLALERNTILRWLKESAEETGPDIDVLVKDLQHNADRGDLLICGWIHTKAKIKNIKRLNAWSHTLDPSSPAVQNVHLDSAKMGPLITQLDPDAPIRQNRKLEGEDNYFEQATWLGCYELLRRGKSGKDVMEWCSGRAETWRAVSITGMLDIDGIDEDSSSTRTNNELWRRMCFKLARSGGADKFEKAVYGILSGDIQSVEPVSKTWDDHLFTHYNALLRSQYASYLLQHQPSHASVDVIQSLGVFNAVQYHGEPETAGQRLVHQLRSNTALVVESQRPMKMLQGVLVAKEFSRFAFNQGVAISREANKEQSSNLIPNLEMNPENENIMKYISGTDQDGLRVLAHILLIFRILGLNYEDTIRTLAVENIIVCYISFLRLAGKEEFIPLYASHLSADRLYATLARELIDITDNSQRQTLIKLIRDLDLDVQKFVKFQTRFLLNDFPDESKDYLADSAFRMFDDDKTGTVLASGDQSRRLSYDIVGNKVSRADVLLIRSLEWHLLVDGLWSETFRTGTLLYKRFYKNLNLAAAKQLHVSIASTAIIVSKTPAILGGQYDLAALMSEDEEDLTEQLDEDVQQAAEQRMLLKLHMAAEARSYMELELLVEVLDLMDDISNVMGRLRAPAVDQTISVQDIKEYLARKIHALKPKMNAILTDWLVTSQQEEPEYAQLREAYLPELILAYDSCLHFAGTHLSRDNFLECMELATIIAADESGLSNLFVRKGRMKELVTAFAENSKGLLSANAPSRKRRSETSKKLRSKGWTRDLWTIPAEETKPQDLLE